MRVVRRRTSLAVGLLVLALAATLAASAQAARFNVQVLSNRADLISGGDALVEVNIREKMDGERVGVALVTAKGTRDLSRRVRLRASGRVIGLVRKLPLGRSRIVATYGKKRRSTPLVNHPNGGPVFSGPQVQPWFCQESARDAKCNQPPTYEYLYQSTNPLQGLQSYDPENPPSDVAETTTDEGETVPFIVRIETGYQNRDQYKIATLFQPGKRWKAWKPQRQWNHKVLVTHGSSCGITHSSGEAPSVTSDTVGIPGAPSPGSSPTEALSRGFAVMSTALNHAGHNCNIVTQAESLVMAKERIVEQYGRIRYTIGTGCSGGSLTQQQVANAYPGIYQGILPQCSYPDAISTGIQFADYHGLRLYFEDVAARLPQLWLPAQWGFVEGHLSHANAVAADEAFFKNATNPQGGCVPEDVRYHPQNNPGGVRCSILDYMINVFGPRPQEDWSPMEQAAGRGFAGFPLGNVGVQYGLGALESGLITTEQFVDMNHQGGGLDIDINPTDERTQATRRALRNAYRSGAINEANHMDKVAIIDLRGPDPAIAHDAYRSWELRARLDREHGHHDNHVIWFGPAPLVGDTNFTVDALIAMDEWLTAVQKDRSKKPLAKKIVDNKPADLQDECDPLALVVSAQCDLVTGPHRYGTPRTVAGDAITTDNAECRLKPLERSSYSVTFTNDQWQRLQEAFPTGVCDYSKPGIAQRDTVAWLEYAKPNGTVVYGGQRMGDAPKRSGFGWASKTFHGWTHPE